jgi:protein-S-isoprenylcysteine O-methyltransferase Ste14
MNWVAGAAWVAFCAVWVIGSFVNKRDARRMPAGEWWLHVAVLAVAFNLVFDPVVRTGPLGWRIVPDRDWIRITGGVLQIAGLAFCIWARLHIGRNWSGMVTLKEGHTLVRSGPYGLVRHPIYSGLLLAILGHAISNGKLAGLIALAILVLEWKRKSLMEERLMLEQFGAEYARYRREVKGLVPGVW